MQRSSLRLAEFSPGYFAMVMATGIVSLALHDQGWDSAAHALFAVNIAAYGALWMLTLLRLTRCCEGLLGDLLSHDRSAPFLTMVAATCVLGSQFALLTPWMGVAIALWVAGVGLWVFLNYAFFSVVTLRNPKPPLDQGIHGIWLLAVVATESVAVLGVLVSPEFAQPKLVAFLSLAAALAGALVYLCFITLILYRWMFFSIKPDQLTPDYWINMGALAITTLAGATLLQASGHWGLLQDLRPFLAGFTLLAWSAATWWIPLLLVAGVWRHILGKVSWKYEPAYWSMVFPLGMYATATTMVGKTIGLDFLHPVGAAFAVLSAAAWTAAFFGMLRRIFIR